MSMRIRRHVDGSMWITHNNKKLEAQLDKQHIRVPGSLRWFEKGYNKDLLTLKDKHKDQICYILGKGPSLDWLSLRDLKTDGPVICVNDSVKQINKLKPENPIYVVQQDGNLKEECLPGNEDWTMIISKQSRGWYAKFKNRIIITAAALGVQHAGPTVIVAIRIAKLMGCKSIVLVSFDAAASGNCDYAKIIGYPSTRAGKKDRFLSHKQKMLRSLAQAGLEYEFFTPSASVDTLQPSSERPQQPDEISQFLRSTN